MEFHMAPMTKRHNLKRFRVTWMMSLKILNRTTELALFPKCNMILCQPFSAHFRFIFGTVLSKPLQYFLPMSAIIFERIFSMLLRVCGFLYFSTNQKFLSVFKIISSLTNSVFFCMVKAVSFVLSQYGFLISFIILLSIIWMFKTPSLMPTSHFFLVRLIISPVVNLYFFSMFFVILLRCHKLVVKRTQLKNLSSNHGCLRTCTQHEKRRVKMRNERVRSA